MKSFKEFIPGTGLVSSPTTIQAQSSVLNRDSPSWTPSQEVAKESSLAIHAKEFVPTQKISQDVPVGIPYSYNTSGLENEWIPEGNSQDLSGRNDNLVEVSWAGNNLYIPESMAYSLGIAPNQASESEGLEWAAGVGSLPTPTKRTLQSVGLPEPLRQHFHTLDIDSLRQMEPDDERYKEIPSRYNCAYPLDNPTAQRGAGGSFGYPSCLYKVIDRTDSQLYALRRFDNVRSLTSSVLKSAQTKWTAIRHPSLVSLYSISLEKGAVFFAHAYHPAAQTLTQRYLDPRTATANVVTEALLWRILAQLVTGIRLVHSRSMAVRSISCSHILLTSGGRFRIASVGVTDVLEFESRKSIQDMQAEDLVKLGFVLISLAARSLIGPKTVDSGMAIVQQNFSQDLSRVLGTLISGTRNAEQICAMISGKICDELDFAMAAGDALHTNLRNEYENGRILRLLLKLGLINERPEYAMAPSWSETGDRYVLQLFRDYLFHQTDIEGVPILDLGHVITCLNKLDNGDPEQVLLCSRDGKDILIVSYAEIRRCMEASVMDLMQQSNTTQRQMATGSSHDRHHSSYSYVRNSHPNQMYHPSEDETSWG